MPDAIRLVLDTNVVIDWLVFDDPYMEPLRERAATAGLSVLTHELARVELERVLGYPELRLSPSRRQEALLQYRTLTHSIAMPAGFGVAAWHLPGGFPGCKDRDDDLFLALAYHGRASALVTRDKALLKMRKKVRKFGVVICDVQQMIALLSTGTAVSAPVSG